MYDFNGTPIYDCCCNVMFVLYYFYDFRMIIYFRIDAILFYSFEKNVKVVVGLPSVSLRRSITRRYICYKSCILHIHNKLVYDY